MTIPVPTQKTFEKYLPAFRNPDAYLYNKMESYLSDARFFASQLCKELTGAWADVPKGISDPAAGWICYDAALVAIPQLDLVATPTGFGIVSNEQTAPASRERVEALKESVRRLRSRYLDALLIGIIYETNSLASLDLAGHVPCLFPFATVLRAAGVKLGGEQPFEEELLQFQSEYTTRLRPHLTRLIGEEQTAALETAAETSSFAAQPAADKEQMPAVRAAKNFILALYNRAGVHACQELGRSLLALLESYPTIYTAYAQSQTRKAHTGDRYQNAATDKTFFFG